MEQKNIVIMGGGRLWQAIKIILGKKGVTTAVWDADTTRFPNQRPLSEIIPAADAVFFCVPSFAMKAALTSVAPLLSPACPLVSFAKGIDAESEKTMPELFAELTPAHPLATVGGPMLRRKDK